MMGTDALYHSLSYPRVILTFSRHTLFPQTWKWQLSHSGVTVWSGMKEMLSQNMAVQTLEVATLPLELPCSELVNHSGKIIATGNSHKKKPEAVN